MMKSSEEFPSARAPASAWYALAVLIATTLFAFVDRQIINLLAPAFQKMLGLTDFQLGALNGLGMALFASAAGYPIGWLADRFGRRLVFGGCILFWSASTAACAFQHDFTGLFVATSGIAIGEAALSPIIFSMIPDLFPERQRNAANFILFGAVLLGAAAGLALGGAMLGWLGTHHQSLPFGLAGMDSWRAALVLVSIPAPLFLLLVTTLQPRGRTGQASETIADTPDMHGFIPFVRTHWRTFACLYGAIIAYSVPLNSAFVWLPLAMPRIYGVTPASIGMQLGLTVAVGTLAGLTLAPIGSRFLPRDAALSPLRLSLVFLLLAAPATAFLTIAWAPWQIYAAAGVQMMFLLATGALMPGLLQQIAPPELRSRLISVLGIVQAVANGASPILVGALSGLIPGPRGILIAVVLVGVPGWLIAALLIRLAQRPVLSTIAAIGGAASGVRPLPALS